MKRPRLSRRAVCTAAAALAVLCLGMLATNGAWAREAHVGVGVVIAPPYWGYSPYYPPYGAPYYPPVVVMPPSAPAYVEKGQAQPAPQAPQP